MSLNNKQTAIGRIFRDFSDNTNGDISALILRNWLKDLLDWVFPDSNTIPNGASMKVTDPNNPYGGITWEVLQPVGAIIAFAGNTAPDGWLLCNGSTYDPSIHIELSNILGTTYGTFPIPNGGVLPRLPDLRGRSVVGIGKMQQGIDPRESKQQPTYGLNDMAGYNSFKLDTNELPSHKHDRGTYLASANSRGIDSEHEHELIFPVPRSVAETVRSGNGAIVNGDEFNDRDRTKKDGRHEHAITGESGNTGSGFDIENRSPVIALNYIIKT